MSISAQFEGFRLASIEADEESFGDCRALEPFLLGMLQLVLAHPEHKEFFAQQFILMATGEVPSPAELLPFCMRELKFPEVLYAVRQHFQALHAQNKHARYMNYCSHVVKSYEDFIWEDADMWDYYRSKELVPSAVPELIKRLSITDPEIQFNALYALECMGPRAIAALPAVQAFIDHQLSASNLLGRARLAVAAIQASN
ncbi:hypothetical protein LP420_04895 [Massilia sp. B-10]|nr:hypothetical protein LP420_04895 [Massilia sp. B-10]UUZ55146.1 hypothetical protein LP419_04620 [Massilia sp. H-1]